MYIDPAKVLRHSSYDTKVNEADMTIRHTMTLTVASTMVVNKETMSVVSVPSVRSQLAANISKKLEETLATGKDAYGRDKNDLILNMTYEEVMDMVRLYRTLKAESQLTTCNPTLLDNLNDVPPFDNE